MTSNPLTSAPLRILFVVPGDGQGSSMIFVRRQAESLLREGIEADLFYLRSRTSPPAVYREFRRLRACIGAFRPALVHAQFGTATAALSALAAACLPLMVTYRGGDLNRPPSGGIRSFAARLLSQAAALRAARIVCVSRRLRDRLWWRRDRVTILPSGVDSELFRPEPRDDTRARLGWSEHERVVLFNAGHDPRIKRLDLAEQAAEVARQKLRERGFAELRLEILRGSVDPRSIPTLMNASDCLLIVSDAEGSPAVLQEALACGLPVVSVDVGDAAERLRGVVPSRLASRDPRVLGRALAEITASPMRSNGPETIHAATFGHAARVLAGLYREVIGIAHL